MARMNRRDFVKSATLALAGMTTCPLELKHVSSQGTPYRHSLERKFGEYSHSPAEWRKLRDGLYFTRIEIYNDGKPAESAALVLAEPEHNSFEAHHDGRPLRQKTIEQWMGWTDGNDVMFNSSYYMYVYDKIHTDAIASIEPATRIIMGGRHYGTFVKTRPCGMLLSEPKDGKPPYALLADLTNENVDYSKYMQGVQSWPLLVDAKGVIRVAPSNWYANRTAVCSDRDENILVMTTEGGFFSLYELGRFFKQSRLGVKKAMNMDGGYEADMAVNCGGVRYVTYGQWETQGTRDISKPGIKIGLPAVVGISQRRK